MPQGSIKNYDIHTRTGLIASDDGNTEWEIDAAAMDTGVFRFFRVGQRVTFDLVEEDGVDRPRNLRIGVA